MTAEQILLQEIEESKDGWVHKKRKAPTEGISGKELNY